MKRFLATITFLITLVTAVSYAAFPGSFPSKQHTTLNVSSISLTADNTSYDVTNASMILLDSDNGTATSRTFTLWGEQGQYLVLVWNDASGAGEIVDGGSSATNLSTNWAPDDQVGANIQLLNTGGTTVWTELQRLYP